MKCITRAVARYFRQTLCRWGLAASRPNFLQRFCKAASARRRAGATSGNQSNSWKSVEATSEPDTDDRYDVVEFQLFELRMPRVCRAPRTGGERRDAGGGAHHPRADRRAPR